MATEPDGSELNDFDWMNHKGPGFASLPSPPLSIIQVGTNETPYDRKHRMLVPLAQTCRACSMCELGLKVATRGGLGRDPHVFSNMNPKRLMVVGQGPGWDELREGTPFVGEAGENFNIEIIKNGLSRSDFYITNAVRCFIQNNAAPTETHLTRCKTFLAMEINLIKPVIIITLGAVAFGVLCPNVVYQDALGQISTCDEFGVKVYAAYHPSPLNLKDPIRAKAFAHQMAIICQAIKLKFTRSIDGKNNC